MPKKYLFLLLGLCLAITTLQGQQSLSDNDPFIEWGRDQRMPSNTYISKVVSANKYGFYALRKREESALANEQVYIESYDAKMNLKKSQKLDLKYKGNRRDFEDLIMVGGQLYLLSSFNNQAKKKNYLFYQKISNRSLTMARKFEMIAEIDTRNKEQEGFFNFKLSKDSSKVLIYNQLPYKKNTPERFALRVFNNQFEEQWHKDIILPYNDDNFSIEEYRIDNKGNVYLLGVLFQDRSRVRRAGKPTYRYSILAYMNEGEDMKEYKIDIGDKFITDLTFRIDNSGKLVCSGFYSDKGTYSIKGTYFFKLNMETKQVENKNLKAFDFKFLTEYLSDGQRERALRAERQGKVNRAPELYQFSLDELILRSDGGAVLVAEQYYVYQRRYFDFYGTPQFDNYFNYNDIIVVNIRPNGEIEWTARIPKRQETVNDGGYYSSYAMSIVQDRIYFIYNDNQRNFENDNRRLYNFNGRQSIIALSELRKDGTLNTSPLFSNRDADIITRPKICKQISKRRMMIYGERARGNRFGSLWFP